MTAPSQSRTLEVARYCFRKRLTEADVADGNWRDLLRRGTPVLEPLTGGNGLVPALSDGLNDNVDMVDGDRPADSADQFTAEPGEPVMASPRLIPAPDSPPHSDRDPPEMS